MAVHRYPVVPTDALAPYARELGAEEEHVQKRLSAIARNAVDGDAGASIEASADLEALQTAFAADPTKAEAVRAALLARALEAREMARELQANIRTG